MKKRPVLKTEYKGLIITIDYVKGYVETIHLPDGGTITEKSVKPTIGDALDKAKSYVDWMGNENF